MKRNQRGFVMLLIVIVALGGIWLVTHRPREHVMQTMAVPSYFAPGSFWPQLSDAAPAVGIAIINPHNGPGAAIDLGYHSNIQRIQAKGIKVLGYVATDHARRNSGDIDAEVDQYYAWYQVDGIFFDQASTDCALIPYYKDAYSYVKSRGARSLTVLNPGMMTNECYMAVADVVVTFENTYQIYATDYRTAGWTRKYNANRFWHLVYDTPTIVDMQDAVQLSKKRKAGWVYVTPATTPNPWNVLPQDSYWEAELAALK